MPRTPTGALKPGPSSGCAATARLYTRARLSGQPFHAEGYGRSQTAFSEGGLPIGAGLEDLGKGLTSQVGTMYATKVKGPRYLQLTEGYVTRLALDEEDQIIGYEFVKTGPMMENIKKGMDANEAVKKATGSYGRFADAAKYIDPRHE